MYWWHKHQVYALTIMIREYKKTKAQIIGRILILGIIQHLEKEGGEGVWRKWGIDLMYQYQFNNSL